MRLAKIPQHRYVEVGGLRIHYQYRPGNRSNGAGPAVVLLPGGMLDSSLLTWKPLLERLPPRYRLFSPDLPGYGRSDKPDRAYTTSFFVDFVEGFLDAVGLQRADLLASSMSGAVALRFALQWPERVGRLVLSGAYGFQRRVPLHPLAYALCQIPRLEVVVHQLLQAHPVFVRLALPVAVHDRHAITPALVRDAYAGVQAGHALRAFARWMRREIGPHAVRSHLLGHLQAIRTPTLLLHGAHDWMMPVRYARQAARVMPRCTLRVFAGSGHLVPREQPEATCQLVTTFLRQGD